MSSFFITICTQPWSFDVLSYIAHPFKFRDFVKTQKNSKIFYQKSFGVRAVLLNTSPHTSHDTARLRFRITSEMTCICVIFWPKPSLPGASRFEFWQEKHRSPHCKVEWRFRFKMHWLHAFRYFVTSDTLLPLQQWPCISLHTFYIVYIPISFWILHVHIVSFHNVDCTWSPLIFDFCLTNCKTNLISFNFG